MEPLNRSGLCECGCGAPAPIAKTTRIDRGQVAGLPVRFIVGHAMRGRGIPLTPERRAELLRRKRESERRRRERNGDALRARARALNALRPGELRRNSAAYRARHRAELRAAARDYYAANRERARSTVADRKRDGGRFINAIKGTICWDCGGAFPPDRLHFHHRNPDTKRFDVAGGKSYSRAVLLAEIAKCDVLCPKCHSARHVALRRAAA